MVSKELYIHGVKFVIGSMLDLSLDKENNDGYSFLADLLHYTETIKQENILTTEEFESLIISVFEEKGIKKGTLT